ncbi:hypothetical protein I7V28_05850 [Lelliottia amnigena]|uniref:hypothetical protein n=1 Tax=Lelliottia amnigena TaxID=61646 RepID=UPI00192A897B|nr:hypothetical protein [Lelliottia amnigena]MBL5920648.1 hypothetical protein [Lelliottia amnigena]
MGERKISIVCDGLSSEEVMEWMKCKVQKAALLESALTEKAYLFKALGDVELRIEQLSVEAAVDIASAGRDCANLIPFAELPKDVQVAAPQSGKYIVCHANGAGEWGLKTYTDGMMDAIYAPSNKAAAMYSIECFFAGIEENKSIRNQLLGAGYLSGL